MGLRFYGLALDPGTDAALNRQSGLWFRLGELLGVQRTRMDVGLLTAVLDSTDFFLDGVHGLLGI